MPDTCRRPSAGDKQVHLIAHAATARLGDRALRTSSLEDVPAESHANRSWRADLRVEGPDIRAEDGLVVERRPDRDGQPLGDVVSDFAEDGALDRVDPALREVLKIVRPVEPGESRQLGPGPTAAVFVIGWPREKGSCRDEAGATGPRSSWPANRRIEPGRPSGRGVVVQVPARSSWTISRSWLVRLTGGL